MFVILLDLCAVFDTVNHKLLLSSLENRVGLGRQVLDWATSYLTARYQYVSVSGCRSEPRLLACGVPRAQCCGTSF